MLLRHTGALLVAACVLLSGCGSASPSPATANPSVSAAPASPAPASVAAPTITTTTLPPSAPPPTAIAATACEHRYWPLRTGAKWTSGNGAGGTVEVTVTAVEGDSDSALATQESVTDVSTVVQKLGCDATGIHLGDATYDLHNGHTGTRMTISSEGATLPPDSALVDGATFGYSTLANLDFPAFDSSGNYTGQVKYELDQSFDCTVAGPMSVSVAAGKFNGIEVTCNGMSTRIDSDGTITTTDLNDVQTYYLDGVGPSGVVPGSQLMSYSIPGT